MITHNPPVRTRGSTRPERRGVSNQTVIGEAKAKVSTIDFADRLVAENGGGWRKVGGEWIASCPLLGHEDRSPSFCVNPKRMFFGATAAYEAAT